MKIVTWNINSVRLRKSLVCEFADKHDPDVILLQETKCEDKDFPYEAFKEQYPHILISGEKSYNGVAILSKHQTSNELVLPIFGEHKRHISCVVNGIELHNFYVPAGGYGDPDIDTNPKFKFKMDYFEAMKEWFIKNRSQDNKIILAGDLNIAPYEHDVWSSKQLRYVISHSDFEREKMLSLYESFNWIDTGRQFVKMEEKLYSWWSYRNRDWKKSNRGRRLDHILASPALKNNIAEFVIHREYRDSTKPSDHVPVQITLK